MPDRALPVSGSSSVLRCYSKKEWETLGDGAWETCPTCEGKGTKKPERAIDPWNCPTCEGHGSLLGGALMGPGRFTHDTDGLMALLAEAFKSDEPVTFYIDGGMLHYADCPCCGQRSQGPYIDLSGPLDEWFPEGWAAR